MVYLAKNTSPPLPDTIHLFKPTDFEGDSWEGAKLTRLTFSDSNEGQIGKDYQANATKVLEFLQSLELPRDSDVVTRLIGVFDRSNNRPIFVPLGMGIKEYLAQAQEKDPLKELLIKTATNFLLGEIRHEKVSFGFEEVADIVASSGSAQAINDIVNSLSKNRKDKKWCQNYRLDYLQRALVGASLDLPGVREVFEKIIVGEAPKSKSWQPINPAWSTAVVMSWYVVALGMNMSFLYALPVGIGLSIISKELINLYNKYLESPSKRIKFADRAAALEFLMRNQDADKYRGHITEKTCPLNFMAQYLEKPSDELLIKLGLGKEEFLKLQTVVSEWNNRQRETAKAA